MDRLPLFDLDVDVPELLAGVWRQFLRRLRFHALPLAIVLALTGATQAFVMAGGPLVSRQADTNSYLNVAGWLLRNIITPNVVRTPGYPLFIAEVFLITGSHSLNHIVYAQVALFILSAVEIYALVYILTSRRWIGALVAALVGSNLYLANWSRIILSEPLVTWLLISVMLAFAVYLRRPSHMALALLVALVVATVFTRPQMLFVPGVMLAVLVFRALRQSRRNDWARALLAQWLPIAGMAAAYGLVLLYMLAFLARYGQFTTTRVSNISLLGIAMRNHAVYGMPYTGADPRFDALRADLDATQGYNVFGFINAHKKYDSPTGQFYGEFGSQVLRAHPDYVVRGTYDAFLLTTSWNQIPAHLVPVALAPPWLLTLSLYNGLAYACLPLLLVGTLLAFWRYPASLRATMMATLTLIVFTNVLTATLADFAAESRLRMPVDWAMLTVTVLAIVQICAGAKSQFFGFAPMLDAGEPEAAPVAATQASEEREPVAAGVIGDLD